MKRGIAGSLIFTIFDTDPLDVLMEQDNLRYWKKASDRANPTDLEAINLRHQNGADVFSDTSQEYASYDDQLLPFNIVIFASNEYGIRAVQVVYGVEILNAGAGLSVDDITNRV